MKKEIRWFKVSVNAKEKSELLCMIGHFYINIHNTQTNKYITFQSKADWLSPEKARLNSHIKSLLNDSVIRNHFCLYLPQNTKSLIELNEKYL